MTIDQPRMAWMAEIKRMLVHNTDATGWVEVDAIAFEFHIVREGIMACSTGSKDMEFSMSKDLESYLVARRGRARIWCTFFTEGIELIPITVVWGHKLITAM